MNTRIKLDNYISIYGLINCITLSSFKRGNSFSTETFFGRRDGVAHLPDFKGLIGEEPNLCNQTVHFLNLQFRRTELCPWAPHTTKKYIVYSIFTTEKIVLLSHRFFCYKLQTVCFSSFILNHHLHNQYFLFQTLLLVLLILILLLLSIIFIASGVSDMGAFKKKPYYTF